MEAAELEELVRRAQSGDAAALAQVVRAIQDDVFDLAMRMLGDPTDAGDASQEVLVRIVTKIGSFRGESKFTTWVYRLAANALLNFRGAMRRKEMPFDEASEVLAAAGQAHDRAPPSAPPDDALVNEVKLICAHGMLLCLDRPHRLAYVLGEVLELTGDEAAEVLEINAVAFRKRLSRARDALEAFIRTNCGIANPANACRCEKLLPTAQAVGLIDPSRLIMRELPTREADRLNLEVQRVRSAAEMFRSMPRYASPTDFAAALRSMLGEQSATSLLVGRDESRGESN